MLTHSKSPNSYKQDQVFSYRRYTEASWKTQARVA